MSDIESTNLLQLVEDRDFFRSEDALRCQYKLIHADQVASSIPDEHFDYSEEIQLLGQLRGLQRHSKKLMSELEQQRAPLSEFFSTINHQIELIGHRIFLRELGARDLFGWTLTDVSLGGAGLLTDHLIEFPANIALRVLIEDGAWVLTCFATVRHCRRSSMGGGYRSGIEFISLSGDQQKLLHRYLLSRQAIARQALIADDFTDDTNY